MGAPANSVSAEAAPHYRRILLKVSGEVLAGEGSFGLDTARVQALAAGQRMVLASL